MTHVDALHARIQHQPGNNKITTTFKKKETEFFIIIRYYFEIFMRNILQFINSYYERLNRYFQSARMIDKTILTCASNRDTSCIKLSVMLNDYDNHDRASLIDTTRRRRRR